MTARVLTQRTFPRGAASATFALLAVALLAALAGRVFGPEPVSPPSSVVEVQAMHFQDREDGAITVTNAETGALVGTVAGGGDGFIRGSLRGLARERKRQGIGSETPFLLQRLADGRLHLVDPATNRTIELGAFGPDNAGAFARLFEAGRTNADGGPTQ